MVSWKVFSQIYCCWEVIKQWSYPFVFFIITCKGYSSGQTFTYTHHGHKCHGNLGRLMISLSCPFSREKFLSSSVTLTSILDFLWSQVTIIWLNVPSCTMANWLWQQSARLWRNSCIWPLFLGELIEFVKIGWCIGTDPVGLRSGLLEKLFQKLNVSPLYSFQNQFWCVLDHWPVGTVRICTCVQDSNI